MNRSLLSIICSCPVLVTPFAPGAQVAAQGADPLMLGDSTDPRDFAYDRGFSIAKVALGFRL
ncbi:MAG: hypothetical protein V3T28_08465 [Gemmatimonadales bacterium]